MAGCVRFPGLTDTFYGKGYIQVELKDLYEPSFGVHEEIRNKKYISSAIISNPKDKGRFCKWTRKNFG